MAKKTKNAQKESLNEQPKNSTKIKGPKSSAGRKKTRSRSKEDKDIQMQKIIDGSLELIREYGFNGFGMRALAGHIHMSQGNLYNYIDSMRELWIKVRIRVMLEFRDGMKKAAYSGTNSTLMDTIEGIGEYVLEYARKDMNRWKLIIAIPPPAPPLRAIEDKEGNKVLDKNGKEIKEPYIGPIEKGYKSLNIMDIIFSILDRAKIQGELSIDNINIVGYYLYSVVLGATFVENELNLSEDIYEPFFKDPNQFDLQGFRKLMFSQLKHVLGLD